MEIIRYDGSWEDKWDSFVMNDAVNGTFLQSRRFLNYHPRDRFIDCSLLFVKGNNIIAVIPACDDKNENGRRVFNSHKGSTFGGLIVSKQHYKVKYLLKMVDLLNEYVTSVGFDEALLKITPDIFSHQTSDLIQYILYNRGYCSYKEISTYIELPDLKQDVLFSFSQGKRTNIYNGQKAGFCGREVFEQNEIIKFYNILCDTLIKYNTRPIHSIDELLLLKESLPKGVIRFYGVYLDDKMLAGGMVFHFLNTHVFHTQYLAASNELVNISPMSYLYYYIITEARKENINKLSWGISTEQKGQVLNVGLIESKEAFGSRFSLNRAFYRSFYQN